MIALQNVADVIRRNAKHFPNKPAIITSEGQAFTFKEVDIRTSKMANALIARGVRKGDRVAVCLRNCHQYLELLHICGKGGFVQVNINERLTPGEISYILNHSGARVLITSSEFAHNFEEIKAEVPVNLYISTDKPSLPGYLHYEELLDGSEEKDPRIIIDPNDSALLLYTSGTTGKPKGADLSHRAILANGLNFLIDIVDNPNDIFLAIMPCYHSVYLVYKAYEMRGCTIIISVFDEEPFMRLVNDYKVTDAFLVPTTIKMILNHPQIDRYDLSSLKSVIYAGSPMAEVLIRKALDKFGPIFTQMYGMAENGNLCTALKDWDHVLDGTPQQTRRLTSVGREGLLCRVRVVRDDGTDVEPEEPGEIIIQTDSLFKGYWNNPEATAEVYRDGWYHTSDIAMKDEDGYIYIIDRKNDMIISGGSNVYPREIEEVLLKHPGINDVCVIGVPHEIWGEAVKALVVRSPKSDLTEKEVIEYCRKNLANYKLPKSTNFVEAIPRDKLGKVNKKVIRAEYWKDHNRKIG